MAISNEFNKLLLMEAIAWLTFVVHRLAHQKGSPDNTVPEDAISEWKGDD